jgi:hypothetical protein
MREFGEGGISFHTSLLIISRSCSTVLGQTITLFRIGSLDLTTA